MTMTTLEDILMLGRDEWFRSSTGDGEHRTSVVLTHRKGSARRPNHLETAQIWTLRSATFYSTFADKCR
jgi:hypothetical protein